MVIESQAQNRETFQGGPALLGMRVLSIFHGVVASVSAVISESSPLSHSVALTYDLFLAALHGFLCCLRLSVKASRGPAAPAARGLMRPVLDGAQ